MTSNLAASRHHLLLNQSRKIGVSHELLMRRYAFERFLYRLSVSDHGDAFVLKGAMALIAVTGSFERPTRDMDMLRLGPAEHADELLETIRRIASTTPPEDDAVLFDAAGFEAETINATSKEPGTRILGEARLGNARIPIKIEVSYGHPVTPAPMLMEYPSVLSGTAPAAIFCYTPETILAEKTEAMCSLGVHTSRFKDFYDIRELSRRIEMDGETCAEAFRRTFGNRGTEIPSDLPETLRPEFMERGERGWRSFLRKQGIRDPQSFPDLVQEIAPFVMEVGRMARGDAELSDWHPDAGWSPRRLPSP